MKILEKLLDGHEVKSDMRSCIKQCQERLLSELDQFESESNVLQACTEEKKQMFKHDILCFMNDLAKPQIWDHYAQCGMAETSMDAVPHDSLNDENRSFCTKLEERRVGVEEKIQQACEKVRLYYAFNIFGVRKEFGLLLGRTKKLGYSPEDAMRRHEAIHSMKRDISVGLQQGYYTRRVGILTWLCGCVGIYIERLPQGLKSIDRMIKDYDAGIEAEGSFDASKHALVVAGLWSAIGAVAVSKKPESIGYVGCFYRRCIIGRTECVQNGYEKIRNLSGVYACSCDAG